jgi:hypothetical protein
MEESSKERARDQEALPSKQDLLDVLTPGPFCSDNFSGGAPCCAQKQLLPDIKHALGSQTEDRSERTKCESPQHELPTPPSECMTFDEAYSFLGIEPAEQGNLETLKASFRKLSLKYHPDKNRGREKEAAAAFQGVHAACKCFEIRTRSTT